MFYDPRKNLRPEPLSFNPFNALVAPRPIGWISTVNRAGNHNLAPFSYFGGLSSDPAMVNIAINSQDFKGTVKDTLKNLREVPEFVVNIVSWGLHEQMNQTSKDYPYGDDEFTAAGLSKEASTSVSPPRVKEVKAALECTVHDIIELPSNEGQRTSNLVIGIVSGIFIDDSVIDNGRVQAEKLQQVSRLGYMDYAVVDKTFEILRPK